MAGNLGFETFVVSDATATFARAAADGRMRDAEEVHQAALGDLAGELTVAKGQRLGSGTAIGRRRSSALTEDLPQGVAI